MSRAEHRKSENTKIRVFSFCYKCSGITGVIWWEDGDRDLAGCEAEHPSGGGLKAVPVD